MKYKRDYKENLVIKIALEEFRRNDKEDAFIDLVLQFVLLIGDGGTAPTPIETEMQIVSDSDKSFEVRDIFSSKPKRDYHIVIWNDKDGHKWVPLYTDRNELRRDDSAFAIKNASIRELFEEALFTKDIEGIIINPNSDSYGVGKELLRLILAAADGLEEADNEAG